jgi:hypothetical protein
LLRIVRYLKWLSERVKMTGSGMPSLACALPSFSAKRIGFATETLILPHQAFFVSILYTNV